MEPDTGTRQADLLNQIVGAALDRVNEEGPSDWDGFTLVGDATPERCAVWMVIYTDGAPGVQVPTVGPTVTTLVGDLLALVRRPEGSAALVVPVHRATGTVDGRFHYDDDMGAVRSRPGSFPELFESLRPQPPG